MKSSYSFKHDFGARNDPKIIKLQRVHGWAGIGLYWSLVEIMYEQGGRIHKDCLGDLAFNLRAEASMIESVTNDFGLFESDGESVFSRRIIAELDSQKSKSDKRKIAASKRWGEREQDANAMQMHTNTDANAMQMHTESDANAMQMQCKCINNEMQMHKQVNANAMQMHTEEKSSDPIPSKDKVIHNNDSEDNIIYNNINNNINNNTETDNITVDNDDIIQDKNDIIKTGTGSKGIVKGIGGVENEETSEIELELTVPPQKRVSYDWVMDKFNFMCPDYARVIMLSEVRKNKIKIRLEEMRQLDPYSDVLGGVFLKMQNSKFLKGDNPRGWKATFDWVIENPRNWVKVYEGQYDDKNVKKDRSGLSENKSVNEIWK